MSGLRLAELRLEPWGCFEDLKLPFGPAGGVDLVLGPNAAGKSTLTRGILALLFGIAQRTPDAHTFDYQDLRVGAKLTTDDGSVDLVRRKGRVGTLTSVEGDVLSDDFMVAAAGGIGSEVFESLLLIDNDALKKGGAELLQGKGEVGASLFAAAAGIASLHDVIAQLDDEARAIFSPRARTDRIHLALRNLKDAEKRLREAIFRPQRHKDMEREVRRLAKESKAISAKIRDLTVERGRLDRRRKVAPLVKRHGELAERLDGLKGTPQLPASAREDRIAAEAGLGSAEKAFARAEKKRADLLREIGEQEVDSRLAARAAEIEALVAGHSAVLKGEEDKPRREREVIAAEEKVAAAAQESGVAVEEIEGLRRSPAVRGRLDEAVSTYGTLAERLRAATAAREEAAGSLRLAVAQLDETPEPLDSTGLSAALDAARKLGPIEAAMAEAEAEMERLDNAADLAFARLLPRPSSLDALAVMVVPAGSEVSAWLGEDEDLRRHERDLQNAEETLRGRAAELDRREDEIGVGAELPGPEDLAAARAAREASWQELRGSVAAGTAPATAQMDGHEAKVAEADSISDRQLEGSSELERMSMIGLDRRALDRDRAAHAEAVGHYGALREARADEWLALWAPAGIEAPRSEGASEWMREREKLLELVTSRDSAKSEMKAMATQQADHCRALLDGLPGISADVDRCSFGELLEIAERSVAEAAAAGRRHEDASNLVADAERLAAGAEEEAERAAGALELWTEEWPGVLDAVGLPSSTTPQVATRISRAVADGLDQLQTQRELERRIAGIDRDSSDYAERVAALVAEVAPDLDDRDPGRAASLLGERLVESRSVEAARTALLGRLPDVEEDVEASEKAIAAAKDSIAAVLTAAGCDELDALPEIEVRSAEAESLREEMGKLEMRVVDMGEGGFDELVASVDGLDIADAEARLQEVDDDVEELTGTREAQNQELGAKEAELRSAEADTAAIEAREEIEFLKEEIRGLVRDYAVANLGSVIVRRAMERYRREHENPLLKRANELFARITLGDFVELFVDQDDQAGPVLLGRQRDRKIKRVDQMSRGTREQLFLSLRIAVIERFVETTVPVPVIFDDAFLESDDDRSEKIFESLAELATKTQVIVLTHRPAQAELGERVLGAGLTVADLPGSSPPALSVAA